MLLSELETNDKAKIIQIDADIELKQRLFSFGIVEGAIIEIIHYSIGKKTIDVLCEDTQIALRLEEAKKIKVIRCEQ